MTFVCSADDLCVLGKAPAAEILTAVKRLMDGLKLPVNEQKTRCLRCPELRQERGQATVGKGVYGAIVGQKKGVWAPTF